MTTTLHPDCAFIGSCLQLPSCWPGECQRKDDMDKIPELTRGEIEIAVIGAAAQFVQNTGVALSEDERNLFRAAFAMGAIFGHERGMKALSAVLEGWRV